MTPGPIVVINPNSNEAVTTGLDDALAAFRLPGGPGIDAQRSPRVFTELFQRISHFTSPSPGTHRYAGR